ncbi:MAG: low affinity iron permease family protein [Phenylobacterium sp.]|uniref:low affinity iron permease family protein n=1 Tax=Phenylobacterium sp. TaxID=1871053 RepID=UPI001A60CB2E|nr:low affinity iron permease family protein [Phenylobacterium sp.]MBL8556831.1 low affinity iron permease family protein [Phenylobacterium sp.]
MTDTAAARPIHRQLTALGVLTARPVAFVMLGGYVIAWIAFDAESFDMHGGAALGAWLMTLFIQRAAHRDTQAIQAKLDELLRAHEAADADLSDIDAEEPEEIERRRARDRSVRDGPNVSIPKNQKR